MESMGRARPNAASGAGFASGGPEKCAGAIGGERMTTLHKLLEEVVELGGSDLHLTAGIPPMFRVDGAIRPSDHEPMTPEATEEMIYSVLREDQKKRFEQNHELDLSFGVKGLCRFRMNVFLQRGVVAAAIRQIPYAIPEFERLGLPPVVKDFAACPNGLVLVTGPTGSGKSTTLAALIDRINSSRQGHILTIEDPIEFLHTNKRSIVNQREVGLDTRSYARALRSAMRAAPDVILIGEIRDRETMEAAINLAGTGHLCIATLHANNAAETLDRIINMFPRDQHEQVFLDLSQYLRGIVSQRLVRARNARRAPAVEVLINTPHMQELIKKGDVIGVKEAMGQSSERGIQTFDGALLALYRQGTIDLEEALRNADSRTNLEARINFG